LAGQYATLICGQAKANGEVEIHNAGHLPAIVAGQGGVLRIESTGLPLGMFCEVDFAATRIQLEVGDLLFLYTDGLSEARKEDDEYGVDRITQLIRQQSGKHPTEVVAAFLKDVNDFADPTLNSDDLSMLAIRRC
jgi:sigma-B regulation protein RsbU (phosphoserine phosphatase)